jgi:CRP/FNR family transcriptional regulator, cyclic AMP receptor protein
MAILRRKRDTAIEELRGIRLFSTAEENDLRRIKDLADTLEVPEGTVLTEEDEFEGGEFFVVVDGHATVSYKDKQVATLEPGSFFGEMGAIEMRTRSATVTAASPMVLLVFDRFSFDRLLADAPSVARSIIREMGRRIRLLEEELAGK